MKLFLKVVVAVAVLAIAYRFGTDLIRRSDEASTSATASSESPWKYEVEVDPVTKQKTARAAAQLHVKTSAGDSVVADVAWDCSDGTTDSVKLEITTFSNQTDEAGKLKALEQDENHAIDYRFDGVASSISSRGFLTGATIRREYRNSVKLFLLAKAGLYGRHRYPGLYVAAGRDVDNDASYDTKAFYIVDPEFVARIPLSGGTNVVIQFSLEDPSIKRMLSDCGVTYGSVPVKKMEKRQSAGDWESQKRPRDHIDYSDIALRKSNSGSTSAVTPPRMDPQHPLRIGREYYPEGSLQANEEGRCIVQLKIGVDGAIREPTLKLSSGYQRLDDACIKAVQGQQMIPAIEGGHPVEKVVSIPIVWKMGE